MEENKNQDNVKAEEHAEKKEEVMEQEEEEEEEEEEDDDDNEEEEQEVKDATPLKKNKNKKKKNKNKKKAAAGGSVLISSNKLSAASLKHQILTKSIAYRASDEEFNKWASEALSKTANQIPDIITPDLLLRVPSKFSRTNFTGTLRPAYVTRQMKIPSTIPHPDYGLDSEGRPLSELSNKKKPGIHVHTPEEVERARKACYYGREILDIAARFLKVGVTGDEIDRVVYTACVERGIYPSPLNYYKFPKSLCVSVNEVICHGIPDCRPIQDGDIVNLDVSVYVDGFHSDLNETFMVGNVDENSKVLVQTAYDCLLNAVSMIKPGTMYRDVGAIISKTAAANKCSVVRTYCGHGVGEDFHATPNIPHYAKNKAVGIMKPGHIFTIEPMINFGPNYNDGIWPDDWTSVTKDGQRSAQFEHTFLVTETGVEILTARQGTSTTSMMPYNPECFTKI